MTAHKERAVGDDHLVWQLRNSKGWPTLGKAAADRIELLGYMNNTILGAVEQRDATIEALIAELNTCRMAQAVMDNTVADLEAKLTKAVEALDEAIKWVDRYRWAAPWVDDAHATLAEIKGESKDGQ
jgi:hypothetical protein